MSEKGSVSTYRRIVKSTGLLGGVQVIGIICSFVKVKFIAIWLGAEGVGIINLYNAALEMIAAVTGLGFASKYGHGMYRKPYRRKTSIGCQKW